MKLFKKRSFKFIHSSNEIKATFPLNYKTYTFDARHYRPYMTNNKLTQMEIHSFFQEIASATNNFAHLRIWSFSTNLLSSMILLIGLLLFIFNIEAFQGIGDYGYFHTPQRKSFLLFSLIIMLLLNSMGILAKLYNIRKARSIIESVISMKSSYFGNKRLKWELNKNSIEFITLYNLDLDLETSFEVEYEDFENSKDFMNPELQRSLLTQP